MPRFSRKVVFCSVLDFDLTGLPVALEKWFLMRGLSVNFLAESATFFLFLFLVGYVEERPWWPIQSPNIGGKKKASSKEDREIRSSLFILDLKDGKL